LILTRWLEESICIGDEIVVQVMEVKRRYVRIGIDAPPELSIICPGHSHPNHARRLLA
jgi:carbon storage regulator CsrA